MPGKGKVMEAQSEKNRYLKIAVPLLIVLTGAFATQMYLSSSHSTAVADTTSSNQNTKTITVSGFGQVNIQPDKAILTIGVTTQNISAQDAVKENAEIMSRLISNLKSIGIDTSQIRTIYYNVNPIYDCCSQQKLTGYSVSNQIEVTVLSQGNVTSLGIRVGQVIDVASSSGANTIYGIVFSASDSTFSVAKMQALTMAAHDASKQANTLAKALGVNITGVVSASPGFNFPYPQPVVFSPSSNTPIVPPSSLTVSVYVTVTYSIT
jgi:uncharacterized protein YggE